MQHLLTAARALLPALPYPYTGNPEACVLCGARDGAVIARVDRRLKPLTTLACTGCGLMRTDPMPTEAELSAYYRALYRLDYQLAPGRKDPPRYHLARSRRDAERRAALLAPVLRRGARVLDVGAGSGEFLAVAKQRGCAVLGIEPGEDYARYARRAHGVAVITEGWTRAAVSEASFDVITANHVLEHLRDPVAALAAIAGWLRPGGVAFVAVPDLSPARRPPFERFHFAHVHNFVPETLVATALRAGLEPDPRFPQEGCTLVLRHAEGGPVPAAAAPNRGRAARIIAGLPPVSPVRHLLRFRWAGDMLRRARRWVADTQPAPASEVPRRPAPMPARQAVPQGQGR